MTEKLEGVMFLDFGRETRVKWMIYLECERGFPGALVSDDG